jgi:TRAP-type C4-dicarboxylate transport system substrate-binding protein
MTKGKFLTILAISTALTGLPAQGAQYNANHFFADQHSMVRGPYVEWAERIRERTDGEVDFRVFANGSLVPAAASLQGVRDNISQVTYHAGTYTPAELPIANLLQDLAFYNTDPLVMAFATTEFSLFDERIQLEWAQNGVVYGGGYSTSPYVMMCNSRVETLADVQGKSMRMAGGLWTRFAEAVGAVPVAIPSTEMYTGLDTGSLDCAVAAADALDSFSLGDVVTSMNTLEIGNFYAGFEWGFNPGFWRELTPGQRAIIFEEMAYYLAQHRIAFDEDVETAVSSARDAGMEVVEPGPDLVAALEDFMATDEAVVVAAAGDAGVDEPEAIVADFKAIVDRWDGLLADVDRTDLDALVDLARTEIYDRLDAETYGIY